MIKTGENSSLLELLLGKRSSKLHSSSQDSVSKYNLHSGEHSHAL